MKSVSEHVKFHYSGNKARFARAVGSSPTVVQQWVNKGFIVTREGFVINPVTTKRDVVEGSEDD